MSQIKLLHSGGNGVSIVAPDSNPASDRTLKLPSDGDGTILTTNSATGKILQVVQAVKTDVSSTSNEAFSDLGSLSVNITPSSSSNKILVNWHGTFSSNSNRNGHIRLQREFSGSSNNDTLYVGDTGESSQPRVTNSMSVSQQYQVASFAGTFLDSPSTTNQITYKLRFSAGDEGYTIYIGQMMDNNNEHSRSRQPASITVMEVAA